MESELSMGHSVTLVYVWEAKEERRPDRGEREGGSGRSAVPVSGVTE